MLDKMVFAMIKARLGETVPFAKHLGLTLNDVEAGYAVAVLPDAASNANHLGSQHAGALFTAADTASGAAVAATFGQKILGLRPVVKEASVRFVKLARGPITATARVAGDLKALAREVDAQGRVAFPVNVTLADATGIEVAAMTFSWHVSKPRPAA